VSEKGRWRDVWGVEAWGGRGNVKRRTAGRGKVGRGTMGRRRWGGGRWEGKKTGVLSLAVLDNISNREIAAPEEVLSGGRRAVFWAPTFFRTKGVFIRPLVTPDDCRSLRLTNVDSSS